jgi:hypothetical protein
MKDATDKQFLRDNFDLGPLSRIDLSSQFVMHLALNVRAAPSTRKETSVKRVEGTPVLNVYGSNNQPQSESVSSPLQPQQPAQKQPAPSLNFIGEARPLYSIKMSYQTARICHPRSSQGKFIARKYQFIEAPSQSPGLQKNSSSPEQSTSSSLADDHLLLNLINNPISRPTSCNPNNENNHLVVGNEQRQQASSSPPPFSVGETIETEQQTSTSNESTSESIDNSSDMNNAVVVPNAPTVSALSDDQLRQVLCFSFYPRLEVDDDNNNNNNDNVDDNVDDENYVCFKRTKYRSGGNKKKKNLTKKKLTTISNEVIDLAQELVKIVLKDETNLIRRNDLSKNEMIRISEIINQLTKLNVKGFENIPMSSSNASNQKGAEEFEVEDKLVNDMNKKLNLNDESMYLKKKKKKDKYILN